MSQKSVNTGGAIRSLSSLGFHIRDLPPEGFDNSIGAGATHIRMTIDSNKTIIFADNGPGMNKQQMVNRFILYEDSPASDNKQGRFGIGEDVKHSLITENLSPSKTISKKDDDILQMILEWPSAVNNNEFPLVTSEASRKSEDEWNKYAIDSKKSGTVDIIPASEPVFKYFTDNTSTIVKHYSLMYSDILTKGVKIEIICLGKKYQLKFLDPLSDDDNTKRFLGKVKRLEIWNKVDGSIRIYFENVDGTLVYRDGKKHVNTYPPLKEEGFNKVGSLTVQSAYNPNWAKCTDMGGIYYKRNTKIIQRCSIDTPSSGDFGERESIVNTRTIVTFSVCFDKLFGLEVNKSHLEKIDSSIEDHILNMSRTFSKGVWKKIKGDESSDSSPVAEPSKKVTIDISKPETNKMELPVNKAQSTHISQKKITIVPELKSSTPASSKIIVPEHSRMTPKSEKDVLNKFVSMYEKIDIAKIRKRIETASEDVTSGLTNIFKSIDEVSKYVI
jgi:hypothetical protein